SEMNDKLLEISDVGENLISFRTVSEKGFNSRRKLQYFSVDKQLKSDRGVVEMSIKDGFELLGYDMDGNKLYLLLTKGFVINAERYLLQIDMDSNEGTEYPAGNVLDMELVEFMVQNQHAIFMGTTANRPVLQIYDLENKSVHTVQGIYGNDTQI